MHAHSPPPAARRGLVPVLLAVVALAAVARGQQWTVEELRERARDFLQPGVRAELRQIGALLEHADAIAAPLAQAIHGDHREYSLKVASYLDQLADPRWIAREDAERTLVEIGARGIGQIEVRAVDGATLEERIRARRVVDAIQRRGMEEERNQVRVLQGLTATAAYLPPTTRLVEALRSALGHTDALVVENALLALGRHGGAAVVPLLVDRVRRPDVRGGERRAALAALGLATSDAARAACRRLLADAQSLSTTEAVALLCDLRARDDTDEVVAALAEDAADPVVRALAALPLPDDPLTPIDDVTLRLADRDTVAARLLGLSGRFVTAAGVVDTLPAARLDRGTCQALEFAGAAPVDVPESAARVFLKQGSLVVGELLGAAEETVTLRSPLFGEVQLERAAIQGIAVDPAVDRLIGASTRHDRIRLRDERMLDARIVGIDEAGVHWLPVDAAEDASAQVVPMADVAGLLFRRPTEVDVDEAAYTRVDLAGGDRLLAHVGGLRGDRMALWVAGLGGATVDLDSVREMEFGVGGGALWGFTLIADYSDNRVIEFDEKGNEVFALAEVYGAFDAECLDNGNLLVTEFALNRVVEITRAGEEVWSYEGDLKNPYDADLLPNGNVLIADTFGERVIEVTREGEIVWEFADGVRPYDAERLANGNTLMADESDQKRVLEVSPEGEVVWEVGGLPGIHDADRLPNGNTLVTLRTEDRVVELDRAGEVVFEITGLRSPSDADRLPNGHTLVAESGSVREFDRNGQVVWELSVAWAVEVNRY